MNKPLFPDRVRQHDVPHVRHTDVQALDALLRIEELLQKLVDAGLATRVQDEVQIEGDIEALVTNLMPTKTPFQERITPKKKNPRQL